MEKIEHTTHTDKETLLSQLTAYRAKHENLRNIKRSRSKLDPFRAEILALISHGASLSEIVGWLKDYRRCKVTISTVRRRLSFWQKEGEKLINHGAQEKGDSCSEQSLSTG